MFQTKPRRDGHLSYLSIEGLLLFRPGSASLTAMLWSSNDITKTLRHRRFPW